MFLSIKAKYKSGNDSLFCVALPKHVFCLLCGIFIVENVVNEEKLVSMSTKLDVISSKPNKITTQLTLILFTTK